LGINLLSTLLIFSPTLPKKKNESGVIGMSEILERIVEKIWDAEGQYKALMQYYKQVGLI